VKKQGNWALKKTNRTGLIQVTGFCFISHFPSLSNLISRERSSLLSLVSLVLLRRDSRLQRGGRRALAAAPPRRNKINCFFFCSCLESISTISPLFVSYLKKPKRYSHCPRSKKNKKCKSYLFERLCSVSRLARPWVCLADRDCAGLVCVECGFVCGGSWWPILYVFGPVVFGSDSVMAGVEIVSWLSRVWYGCVEVAMAGFVTIVFGLWIVVLFFMSLCYWWIASIRMLSRPIVNIVVCFLFFLWLIAGCFFCEKSGCELVALKCVLCRFSVW